MQYFATKKLSATIHGLRPSGVSGRLCGPKVLVNSIPKAGTHLVESALDHFPLLRNAATRTLRGWDRVTAQTIRRIAGTPRGLFRTGHLPAHPEVLDAIHRNNIRVIFVIRDPRDIVISNYTYATYVDQTHPTHSYFKKLPNDETRLLKTILGEPGLLTPIADILDRFEPWLTDKNSVVVRFEDLVGAQGGGQDKAQSNTIRRMAKHLDIEINDMKIQDITAKVFGTKSLTFRKGQIGKWRNIFSTQHIQTFQNAVGKRTEQYGYTNLQTESGAD